MSERNIIFRENRGTGGGSGTTDETKCINTNRYINEDETFPKITCTETKGTRREKARRIELDAISSPFVNRPLKRRRFYFIYKRLWNNRRRYARHYGDCSASLLGSRPRDNTRNASGALLAELSLFQIIVVVGGGKSPRAKKIGS